jgi:hypothetical protein
LQRSCFCPPPNGIDVTVVNHEIREILDPDSGEPVENLDPFFPVTIDDLFDLLEDAIDHADFVDVDYDPVFGAPIRIEIDYLRQAVDDELSFLVSDLRLYRGNECRDTSDCGSIGAQCIEPGGFVDCGICDNRDSECKVDDACTGGALCRRQPKFSCLPCDGEPIYSCRAACASDDECRDGEVCASDGHCSVVHCLTSAECSIHFDCNVPDGTRTAICERRGCVGDIDCIDGFCVNGKCYDQLGRCEIIPP